MQYRKMKTRLSSNKKRDRTCVKCTTRGASHVEEMPLHLWCCINKLKCLIGQKHRFNCYLNSSCQKRLLYLAGCPVDRLFGGPIRL